MTAKEQKPREDRIVAQAMEGHRRLHGVLSEARAVLERWKAGTPLGEEDRAAVLNLRRELLDHFRTEESGGFLHGVVKERPERTADVEALQQEHREMEAALDRLVSDASGDGPDAAALSGPLESLLGRLEAHERVENDLVQRAFYRDAQGQD